MVAMCTAQYVSMSHLVIPVFGLATHMQSNGTMPVLMNLSY